VARRKKPWKGQPPSGWINWRAQLDGQERRGGAEFALYTDCHTTDSIRSGIGPYRLVNTVPTFSL